MSRREEKHRFLRWIVVLAAVVTLTRWNARAQTGSPAEAHLAAARTAAGREYAALFNLLCVESKAPAPRPATPPPVPPDPAREVWYAEPAKVFDNLYYVGSKDVAAWAVTTSDGIILIDALFDYSVEEQIVNGLRKLGFDPAQLKYLIITHAHTDHYLGARFLQEKFGVSVLMSAQDWDYMQRDTNRRKPNRDMVAADGQKLTLGDTTITMYVTPGHTPGTLSLLIPVKDGQQTRLAAMYGGTAFNFPWSPEAFSIYAKSTDRFRGIVGKSPVDILLTNHPRYSMTFEKIDSLKQHPLGSPHPFVVGNQSAQQYITVLHECAQYQHAQSLAAK